MNIKSAKFIKGIIGPDEILNDKKPQVAFIGRSNVGKSSTINALAKEKNLAKTSSFPGRTQQINIFLINNEFYLVDLPGYGFAKASRKDRQQLEALVAWYLFDSPYKQRKIILIIDANIGLTDDDLEMIYSLEEQGKKVVIVANKIDKIKASEYQKKLQKIAQKAGIRTVIPYSAEKRIGIGELAKEMLE